jgi:hypothetical protein
MPQMIKLSVSPHSEKNGDTTKGNWITSVEKLSVKMNVKLNKPLGRVITSEETEEAMKVAAETFPGVMATQEVKAETAVEAKIAEIITVKVLELNVVLVMVAITGELINKLKLKIHDLQVKKADHIIF